MLLWFTTVLRPRELLLGERVRGEKGELLSLPLRLLDGLALATLVLTSPAAEEDEEVGVEAAVFDEGSNLTTLRGARRDRPPDDDDASLAVGDTRDGGGANALGVQGDSGSASQPFVAAVFPIERCFSRLARGREPRFPTRLAWARTRESERLRASLSSSSPPPAPLLHASFGVVLTICREAEAGERSSVSLPADARSGGALLVLARAPLLAPVLMVDTGCIFTVSAARSARADASALS